MPGRPEDREVVVLEEEHGGAVLVVEHPHLLGDLRGPPCAHDLPGSRSVEHVDRAEGAGACAAAAREQSARTSVRGCSGSGRCGCGCGSSSRSPISARMRVSTISLAVSIDRCRRSPPVAPEAEMVDELEQGQLALEAHDAVELRDERQRLFRAEAREVAAHREVAVDAVHPQVLGQPLEPMDVELEDQREADEHGLDFAGCLEEVLLGAPRSRPPRRGIPALRGWRRDTRCPGCPAPGSRPARPHATSRARARRARGRATAARLRRARNVAGYAGISACPRPRRGFPAAVSDHRDELPSWRARSRSGPARS